MLQVLLQVLLNYSDILIPEEAREKINNLTI